MPNTNLLVKVESAFPKPSNVTAIWIVEWAITPTRKIAVVRYITPFDETILVLYINISILKAQKRNDKLIFEFFVILFCRN